MDQFVARNLYPLTDGDFQRFKSTVGKVLQSTLGLLEKKNNKMQNSMKN